MVCLKASAIVDSLMNQVIRACVENNYDLDAHGNTTWIWAWTLQSGILFTLTTLATIGYFVTRIQLCLESN